MTPEEAYAAFIDGLTPALRAQIGALTQGDLDAAMLLAERMDLFQASSGGGASTSTTMGGGSSGGGGRRGRRGGQGGKGGGQGRAAEASAAESSGGTVEAVQGKGKAQQKKKQQRKKGERGGQKCFACGGDHLLRDCPDWNAMKAKMGKKPGNA